MRYFEETEIRKTIAIMKPNGQLFEVRIIYNSGQTISGYFKDADTLIEALKKVNPKDCNVYLTLNRLDENCYGRTQIDHFEKAPKNSTSDKDVVGYDWFFIDLDPDRPAGTSSTDEQLEAAKKLCNKIFLTLKNMGFETPIIAMSGNGVHLLYKIHIGVTDERKALLKKCLEVLSAVFNGNKISVDLKNHNPGRVCKLYGCLSQKGANTKSHPHRMSQIISAPNEIKVTDVKYLEKLAAIIPDEPPKPQQYNSYKPQQFDLEQWLQKYGIGYKSESYQGGTKYVLDHCVFDENHKGKDAVIFKAANGAIAYHCFHNSCAEKKWADVRKLFEPNAYEKQWQADEKRMYSRFNRNVKETPKILPVDNEPVFLSAKMILERAKKSPQETFIKTGIHEIDRKMRGLKKTHVSVWSGLRASGKSSVLSQIVLNAVNAGNNVGVFSGELTEQNFMRWMNLQAAGKPYVKPSQYEGYYNTPLDVQTKIADWLEGKFWLYNNVYGNNYQAVMEKFEEKIAENKLDLLILDNLMAFNIADMGSTKWDAQTAFVWSLTQLAKSRQIHIAFVAHPKKSQGFLRFDDISGTADLGNAVDDAFIVHRVNNDFRRLSAEMFEWHDDNPIYNGTNVIEIVKDRDGGTQDVFVPLYYEVESKRLKNDISEMVFYGWTEEKKLPVNFNIEDFDDAESDNPFD